MPLRGALDPQAKCRALRIHAPSELRIAQEPPGARHEQTQDNRDGHMQRLVRSPPSLEPSPRSHTDYFSVVGDAQLPREQPIGQSSV